MDINSELDESSTDQELAPTSTTKLARKDKMKKEKAMAAGWFIKYKIFIINFSRNKYQIKFN